MKNLIKLIKSDNWVMVFAILVIAVLGIIAVTLCRMFPNVVQVIAIILGIGCIVGVLTTICVWLFMYQVEKACNEDNQRHYSRK
jgi:glucan phosphoethanolaminetransferase (alkaline phosphatase superfamily)